MSDAWRWYEHKRQGLGDELRACVEVAISEVARAPLSWPKVRGDIRRRAVRRFPYAVLYVLEPQDVEVLAIFHSSRDPMRRQSP